MKVLLLTWDFPPVKGGIQIWMFELAKRLPDAEVLVLAPAAPESGSFDAVAGVRVRRVGGERMGQRLWLALLAALTVGYGIVWRPDVILCSHVLTAPAAFLARRFLGIPYVVVAHAYEIRRKAKRRLVSFFLRRAALVCANSHFTEASVLAHDVPCERVRVLHPGVDPEQFAPGPDAHGAIAPPPTKILLSVSRLTDLYKGHDTVIRALALVNAKTPGVRYVIAGDGRLRGYYEQLARSLGVEENIVFLGEVPDETLRELYRSCDLLVQLSREAGSGGGAEGFGIVCLEAAAAGKPVVAGRSGGLVDAVSDGLTGILVDPKDLGEVAEAIVSLLRDPGLAKRLGQQGRARVLREFTWDHMARKARRLFAEAAGQEWEGASERSEGGRG